MYRQQGHISHLLHATKSDTSLHILQHTMVHLFGNFLWSGLFTHVCQCKELQKEFRLLFHSHWSYVRGLGAFVGVMMLSSWDPRPIAEIPSDPRSILYRSSDSVPTILRYSNTTLTKTPNSEYPQTLRHIFYRSPNSEWPWKTPITFLSSFVFIVPF